MTDISKCDGEGCRDKETCWRYKAPDDQWQSYGDFKPVDGGKCEDYWEVT